MFTLSVKKIARLNKIPLKNRVLRLYATQIEPVSKPVDEEYQKQMKKYETLSNIKRRTREKKPQRQPFVKNILLGNFDTEILTFPQLDNEESKNLERDVDTLRNLLGDEHMVNADSLSNKNFRRNLADSKGIGLQASQFLDCRESTPLEVVRFLEVFSEHRLGDNIIHNEQLGVQTLNTFANDNLNKKYLPPLLKGEKLSAFCMTETNTSDMSFNTKAELSRDQKHWILNGNKTFVVNGVSADCLVVFAKTNLIKRDVMEEIKVTAFLVEKDFPGVSWKKIEGCDLEIADISFVDTPVPVENVIGTVDEGASMLSSIISDFRLSCGPSCITLTKKIIGKLFESIIEESTETLPLHKTDAVRSKFGEMAVNLYAAESVTYLTAGLQDYYENQDVSIESSIVKVLASETAFKASISSMEVVGFPASLKDHWANKMHLQALNYITLHETNESQRMVIALLGLEFAAKHLQEIVKKHRNPLFNASFTIARMWTRGKDIEDKPKLDLGLGQYLHPSLVAASLHLEYCVKRLSFITEHLLAMHGLEIVNRHIDLRRLADCMIDVYAMTAVLARASRSYCTGIRNSDYEMMLAGAFCNDAQERVRKTVLSAYTSEYKANDNNFKEIGKQITRHRKYFIENALTRNI